MLYQGAEFKAVFHRMILDKNPKFPLSIDDYTLTGLSPLASHVETPNGQNTELKLVPNPGMRTRRPYYNLRYRRLDFTLFYNLLEKHNLIFARSKPETNRAYLEAVKYLLKEDLGIDISIDEMSIDTIDKKHYLSIDNHLVFMPLDKLDIGDEAYPYKLNQYQYKFIPEMFSTWVAKKPTTTNSLTVYFAKLDTKNHYYYHQIITGTVNTWYDKMSESLYPFFPHTPAHKVPLHHRLIRLSYSQQYKDCVDDGFDWQELYPQSKISIKNSPDDDSYVYGNYLYQLRNKSDMSIAQSNIVHCYSIRKNNP